MKATDPRICDMLTAYATDHIERNTALPHSNVNSTQWQEVENTNSCFV